VIMPLILVMLTSEERLLILQSAEDSVLDLSQWNGSLRWGTRMAAVRDIGLLIIGQWFANVLQRLEVSVTAFPVYILFRVMIARGLKPRSWLVGYDHADRLCVLVVRVSGCRTELYCVSCKVRTEVIYVM
jgi:hypothetical protein